MPDIMFSREELRQIRQRVKTVEAQTKSSLWKRALLRLADSADHLDSMMAREEAKRASMKELPKSKKPVVAKKPMEPEKPKAAPQHENLPGIPDIHAVMDEDFRE